jgi:ABC-type xylose transport system permease subunit
MWKSIVKLILLAFLLTCTFKYVKANSIWNLDFWTSHLTDLAIIMIVFLICNKAVKVGLMEKKSS